MEFIRPLVEERSAKIKEFGEDWDDAPVGSPVLSDFIFIYIRWDYRATC
jgi:hypothetical protein